MRTRDRMYCQTNWFGESHITLLESQLPGVCVSLLLLEVLLLVRHKRLWRVRLMWHGQPGLNPNWLSAILVISLSLASSILSHSFIVWLISLIPL